MKRLRRWIVDAAPLIAVIGLALVAGPLDAQPKNTVVAAKVTAPPAMDGTLDAAWNAAAPLTVKAIGGKNLPGGSTDVTIRAVYTADTVYFHMQYKDPTQSAQRSPWVKQPDGSWKTAGCYLVPFKDEKL